MSHKSLAFIDDPLLMSLFEVNLKAYVNVELDAKDSLDKLFLEIENGIVNYEMVIFCPTKDESKKALEAFLKDSKNIKQHIKYIFITNGADYPVISKFENVVFNPSRYNLKELVKAAARIVNIKAEDMLSVKVEEYFPIPLYLFTKLDNVDFTIYQKLENDFHDHMAPGSENYKERVASALKNNILYLYIKSNERLKFIFSISSLIIRKLTTELEKQNLSSEDAVQMSSVAQELVAESIFESDKVTTDVANLSKACIAAMNQVVKQMPKLKNLMAIFKASKSHYVYMHGIIATYLSSEIIKNISWGSDEQVSKVCFAHFFHDIYLVKLYTKYPDANIEEDLLFRADVSEKEKELVISHAQRASQLVKTFPNCPMGADMIIAQHHGMTNGMGFNPSPKDDISPLAKVMIIAEEISNLVVLKVKDLEDLKNVVNKEEIMASMKERYKARSYQKIIDAIEGIEFY
jgi:HD-GYP domain-containing protein (c-di-GMP phosphodiesterase class II)